MVDAGTFWSAAGFVFSVLAAIGATTPRYPSQKTIRGRDVSDKRLGLWVTADGLIRHELMADGQFVEAHWSNGQATKGRYRIEGDHITYEDENGWLNAGDFKDGMLYRHGMVLYHR